jgi:hypothetical protein
LSLQSGRGYLPFWLNAQNKGLKVYSLSIRNEGIENQSY